jgi:hypothetical protein
MDQRTNRQWINRVRAGGFLGLFVMLSGPVQGEQHVTLAWDPSPDSTVIGYRLYYGATSSQYTNALEAGKATTITVSGLEDGVTYFYAVTAYDAFGIESDFSNEVRSRPNQAPVLQPVPNQVARIDRPLVVTNAALDPEGAKQTLRFSLGPDAPTGAVIDPVTGIFRWQPTLAQASLAHSVTVQVTDSGSPPLTTATRFTVWVRNPLEVQLGSASLRAGERGNVAVQVSTHLPLAALWVVVKHAPDYLTDLAVDAVLPNLAEATVTSLDPEHALLYVSSRAGQPLVGTQAVVRLGFTAVPGQPTALISLNPSDVLAEDVNGQILDRADFRSGRVIVIGDQLMLEAFQPGDGARELALYGNPPATVSLEMATNAVGAPVWRNIETFPLTSTVQRITSLPPKTPFQLFRARKL